MFIKTNSSWLIFESIKALGIKNSMLFDLGFAKNTILSSFFFFFLIFDLYFLIPAVITQIFDLISEIVIPIGIPTKEGKTEMEAHPVTAEIKTSKCSISLKTLQTFLCFLLINSFWFISSVK